MSKVYQEDLKSVAESIVSIEPLKGKSFFITGANGLIGSFIVDVLVYLNNNYNLGIVIIANSRNEQKLKKRFSGYFEKDFFKYYIGDVNEKITYEGKVDYIINCASNTHPLQYSTDPINTIMTNIKGVSNILDFATQKKVNKTIFLSSVEIYGENINNIERFKENEMGYIDCNSLRAGYNESKRCGEALCQAYIEQNGLDISIVRLPRIYGPTVKGDDSKALSQFINKALNAEDIVLKSNGEQFFSYLYVADAVSGILKCLISGIKGEAYNLGNIESDIRLKDLAELVAKKAGVKVIFDLPDDLEAKGFSKATIARMDYSKAEKELGWEPKYSIEKGLDNTLELLKENSYIG